MNRFHSLGVVAALAAAFALPTAAFAQSAPASPPPIRHHHRGPMRMLRGLHLTQAQHGQIRTLMEQFRQAHPRGSTVTPQDRKALRNQIFQVLTPQQQAQLKTRMQHAREMRSQPPANQQP